jgi:putative GTP pyrophosphokinase
MFPDGLSLPSAKKMNDAVAGRVTVYFLSNIPLLHREILDTSELEVSEECPPLAYLDGDLFSRLSLDGVRQDTKESGYASVHYVLRFRDGVLPLEHRPWWELQVRTLTEHAWAQIHHILGYKGEKKTDFAVARHFRIVSSHLRAIDETFNLLFDELTRFQEETQNLGDEDLLNAENLPAVLHRLGTGCAQREIDGLLKMLNSRGIATVGELTGVGTPTHIEIIRNTYFAHEGHAASNFEVVASLAAIVGLTGEPRIVAAIRTQIDFLRAWEGLKKEFAEPPPTTVNTRATPIRKNDPQ